MLLYASFFWNIFETICTEHILYEPFSRFVLCFKQFTNNHACRYILHWSLVTYQKLKKPKKPTHKVRKSPLHPGGTTEMRNITSTA